MKRVAALALVIVFLVGGTASAGSARRAPVTVTVMTRNLYLGTNLDRIVHAKSAAEAFAAVEVAWRNVQANRFPARARAIAREIATTRPDFVGLQEVTLYRTQAPADFTVTPARTVALDYVRERVDDLQKRVRGLEGLDKRLSAVERRLDKIEGKTRTRKTTVRKTTTRKKMT